MKRKGNYILPILLFLYLFWPIRDFGVPSVLYEAIMSAFLLIYILKNRLVLRISNINKYYVFISIIILIQFLLPNASEDYRHMLPIVLNMFLSSLCILTSEVNKKIYVFFMRLAIISGLLYSIFLIFFTINSSLYINYVLPILNGVDKNSFIELMNHGYGIPIAGSVVYVSYLIMLCISIIVLFILNKDFSIINNRKCIIYVMVLLVAQFLVGRRGELIALLITILILYILSNEKDIRKKVKRLLIVLFVLFIGGLVVNVLIKNGYLSRLAKMNEQILSGVDSYDDLNGLSTNRINLWMMAIETFKTSPIFGIGLGRFRSDINLDTSINVHNTYLQFLCESGIVGFVLLVIPIAILYIDTYKTFRKYFKCKNLKKSIKVSIGISFCIQTYFGILNFIDPAFYKSFYSFVYAISIILLEFSKKEFMDWKEGAILNERV